MQKSKVKLIDLLFIVEKTDTGFSAYCATHPIFTTADSVAKLFEHTNEAVSLYAEEEEWSKPFEIHFEIDLPQFFQHYPFLSAKSIAQRIGMNSTLLSQYVTGVKKPSAKQKQKILLGIHQIGSELINVSVFK